MLPLRLTLTAVTGFSLALNAGAQSEEPVLDREQIEFFESKIRPVLVERCYECHSADAKKVKGGLLLDSREGLRKGGDTGAAIIAGDVAKSPLLAAVRHEDKDLAMPPKTRLPAHEIAALEEWVRQGAPDPRTGPPAPARAAYDWEKERQHWAYQPPRQPEPPPVQNAAWARNEIDRFILAALEEKGLAPVADADRRTLLRRATYDLIGLPPTSEEVAAFVSDTSPEAFAKVVDRLLASRHYGERWARHWMDVVRYADTAGDNSDYPIPQLWRYRNYLIDAFNRDKPYDRFVREQIAGDLLPASEQQAREEGIIGTGYLALARRFGSVVERYPQHLTIEDTIDNLGKTFLGLSISCARCHDHKFDAITQRDYTALYGIFASTRYAFPGLELLKLQKDFVPLLSPEETERQLGAHRVKERALRERQREIDAQVGPLITRKKELEARTADPGKDESATKADLAELRARFQKLRSATDTIGKDLEKLAKERPKVPDAYGVQDDDVPADAQVQIKGEPERLGASVPRRWLELFGGTPLSPEVAAKSSGRAQLAEWLVDPTNPLTARVLVNRIWHGHFGSGIVQTPNDFGVRGLPPTHPQLLDWLAARFVADGWSIKQLHRTIMLSRTYQLASSEDERALQIDPDNRLHWRFDRQRIDAEALRDTLLAVSGTLDRSPLEGPHPFPPPEKWEFTQHHPFKETYPSDRRSVYLMTARLNALPFFQTFDGPDRNASTARRDRSVTTVQALFFMNDDFVHAQAEHLARRLCEAASDDYARLQKAYAIVMQRPPTDEERTLLTRFLEQARSRMPTADRGQGAELKVWASLARALFRSNEFLYLD